MKALLLSAALALTAGVASAEPARVAAAAPAYQVIEADAHIPFAHTRVNGYEVGADRRSVIIRTGVRGYYRATVREPCAGDLRFGHRIGFSTSGTSSLDRWGTLFVNGHRCPIQTFDRIAPPVRGAG